MGNPAGHGVAAWRLELAYLLARASRCGDHLSRTLGNVRKTNVTGFVALRRADDMDLADAATRHALTELMHSDALGDAALDLWRTLITATGAVQWTEELFGSRVASAREALSDTAIDDVIRGALAAMAVICTERAQ